MAWTSVKQDLGFCWEDALELGSVLSIAFITWERGKSVIR